jgi:hypothetical protein
MSCTITASGVRAIDLYENIGFTKTYNTTSGSIEAIATTGQTINITNDLKPNYINELSPGANYDLMNMYMVKFYKYDLLTGKALQNTLRNIWGWYAVVTFNSGDIYLIESPLFNEFETKLQSSNTHTWEFELKTRVETLKELTLVTRTTDFSFL